MKKLLHVFILLSFVAVLFACSNEEERKHTVMMATTTSTDNSGLLDYLIPYFEEDTGITVKWIAVGTGAAIEMGINKEVDIIMVHDQVRELTFMEDGYGLERTEFMYNDFIIVGPKDSSIDTSSLESVMTEIKNQGLTFVSRGDGSGTNAKELRVWESFGITPEGDWYIEGGTGMAATLTMADEEDGYTLTDRATFITNQENLPHLKVIYENPEELNNQYGVITIMPDVKKNINHEDAFIFYKWLISARGQKLINEFQLQQQQLFFANANEE